MLVAVISALVVAVASAVAQELDTTSWLNVRIEQTLDLSDAYVRHTYQVRTKNTQDTPNSVYYIPVAAEDLEKVAVFDARDSKNRRIVADIDAAVSTPATLFFKLELNDPVAPGESFEFSYVKLLLGRVYPCPAKAAQTDLQLLCYSGTKTTESLYNTEGQQTKVKFVAKSATDLISGAALFPAAKSMEAHFSPGIHVYGPLENVESMQSEPLKLQYEYPMPFQVVKDLRRTIWISHWGDAVSFDESYDLYNAGTALSHGFSRYTFTQAFAKGDRIDLNAAAINRISVDLPANSRETYYTDLVGNVSTSRVKHTPESDVMDLAPRFPVMGGWFYNFTIGWVNDLSQFVRQSGPSSYVAALPIVLGPKNVYYEKTSTTVVLPEGATNIKVRGLQGKAIETSVVHSYLDIFGRPAVTVHYPRALYEERGGQFFISYDYSLFSALRKPLAYSIGFFSMFAATILASHLGQKL